MLRKICPMGRRREEETYGDWRRRHVRVIEAQLGTRGAEDILTACLRRQFRWVIASLRRFASDLVSQTSRRSLPIEAVWCKMFLSLRGGTLSKGCRPGRAVDCASICLLISADSEDWRLRQAIMGRLDPINSGGWLHQRPGRVGRWERLMVRMAGERWKEALISGKVEDAAVHRLRL